MHTSQVTNFYLAIAGIMALVNFLIYMKQSALDKKFEQLLATQQASKQTLNQLNESVKRLRHNATNHQPTQHSKPHPEPTQVHEAYSPEDDTNASNKLYIGNVDYSVSEEELESIFAPYGELEFVNIPINRYTGKARGFGFVTFIDSEAAKEAVNLNGSELKGRPLQVSFAKERERS